MITRLIKPGSFGNEIVELEKRGDRVYFRVGFNSVKNKPFKKSKFESISTFKEDLGKQFMTPLQAKKKLVRDDKESKRISKVFESKKDLLNKQEEIFLKAKTKYNSPRVVDWKNPEKTQWLSLDKKIRSLN